MTRETLENRIAGKEKALDKLNKKMDRILKAQESGWENNPYYYNERDLQYTQRDIEEAKEALAKYKDMLEKEIEKESSRNVKVLVDFLENWKAKTIEYFRAEKAKYDEALKEYYAKDKEYCEKYNSRSRLGLTREEIKALDKEHREYKKNFNSRWSYVTQFNHGSKGWDETMQRDIEIEKNRKYDDIIERTNAIVGTITDASNLYIGSKQDLNGYIIGERGKAEVRTIGAGGYNIQRFHFRTLVLEMK